MATTNPFDLLGDDDTDDLTQLIAAQQQKPVPAVQPKKPQVLAAQPAKPAKLPSKPITPSQAVKESREPRNEGGRGRSFGRGRGAGSGFNRDSTNNENSSGNGFSGGFRKFDGGDTGKPNERRGYSGPRGSFRGGRRGGFSNGEAEEGEQPKRSYERRSGTGRGNELKREGSGRGNWGTPADEIALDVVEAVIEKEKDVGAEKQVVEQEAADANKENPVNEAEEETENKEMTLEEYEKIVEEKRKALLSLNTTEERKVDNKEFQSMQQLSSKKENDEIFIKLGSDKDKRKDAEKEEKTKKSVVINEFFKSAEGESYFSPRGRGGRDRGGRGDRGSRVGFSGINARSYNVPAPSIEDPGHFPTLGAK